MFINTSFTKLSNVNFAAQAERIVSAMTNNAAFPAPWPSTVPALAQIQADLATFQAAVNDTAAGDKKRIPDRKAARSTLAEDLKQLAFYVQTVAQGQETVLGTTGYPLRQIAPRAVNPAVPAAPAGLKLIRGPVSGSLVVRAQRVPKSGSYDVQIATADPTVEANWTAAGTFKNCGRIELAGLTPGKVYSVRVRAIGTAGPGAWTPPSSLMVV